MRCQRELYLHPIPNNGCAALWFVFLQDQFNPATAPRETSLQRAILDYLGAGHAWRDGGMFLLAEDVRHFGTQRYRRFWPSAESVPA